MTVEYLADVSVWRGRLDPAAAELERRFLDRYAAGSIVTCAFVALERLAGAGSRQEYDEDWETVWRPLRWLPAGELVVARALEVQRLASDESPLMPRRRALPYLVAASAELAGAILWHAEPALDAICALTGQTQESELVPA